MRQILKLNTIFNGIFILAGALLLLISCGKSPSDMPLTKKGELTVSAMIDTVLADSIDITIDNTPYGMQPCPFHVDTLLAGKHQVVVAKPDRGSTINFSSIPQVVEIEKDKKTEVSFDLTKIAPNFSLANLDNQIIELDALKGKVVLLLYFSNT